VNSILDMSKIETGNFEIAPELFAPEHVIADGCDMLALEAREAGIELVLRLPEKLPRIVADKRALSQIVLNLVANAIKFSNPGGCVTVRAKAQDETIVATVEDNGVGIVGGSAASRQSVFQARRATIAATLVAGPACRSSRGCSRFTAATSRS
jgi:cell cycle sensor histidine kinase DivJ